MTTWNRQSLVYLVAVELYLVGFGLIRARVLQSPCPDVFTYQMDPRTKQYFGLIKLKDMRLGEIAKLDVDLSVGMQLPPKLVGSIALVKSREKTIKNIFQGQPALYRVDFPVRNLIPTVQSIALNDRIICTGYRAQGRILTAINLEHTLYTQLQSQKLTQKSSPSEESKSSEVVPKYHDSLYAPPVMIPDSPEEPNIGSNSKRSTIAPPVSLSKTTCGLPIHTFLKQLNLNGDRVEKGQFPWNVPLFDRTRRRNPLYICGSTIITKRYLITAAHCVYDIDDFIRPERLLAIPGMYNIDNFYEENAYFAHVEAVIPHEEYVHDDDLNDADLAVLRLKEDLEFSDYVIPICPWQGENDLSSIVNQEGYLAGWGLTEVGATVVPTYIRTTIVSRRQCNANLGRLYPSNTRIFCGDGKGSAPCNGDSGSGLVLKRGNQYYLRGVVSRGLLDPRTLKCDVTRYAVYTDIALFRFWLKSVIK